MKISNLVLALIVLPLSVFAVDVTGTWKAEFDSQIGLQKYIYSLKQDGSKLTGKAIAEVNDKPVNNQGEGKRFDRKPANCKRLCSFCNVDWFNVFGNSTIQDWQPSS
jgi:hypothetical protein